MKIILGGGIAGLIWAYYNPEYEIITKDVGGQMDSKFDIGPRYLHSTENAKKFLEGLKLPIKERTVKVGYINDSGYTKNPDSIFRQKYYMKSRRKNDLNGFDNTVMNSNKSEFQVLDVDFKELIEILKERVKNKITTTKIHEIDLFKRELRVSKGIGSEKIAFDNLISTIPLKTFSYLADLWLEDILESHRITYCLVDQAFSDTEFDFEYDCSYSSYFHRITKTRKGFVLDLAGTMPKEFLKKKYCYIDSLTLNSQIISLKPELLPQIKTVKFIGRYGTWNRSWKTEKVIEEAIKNYE